MPSSGTPKRSYRKPVAPKVALAGGKALRGRPRKDRMPPIQSAQPCAPDPMTRDSAFLARIGHLAGIEGLPAKFIAVKIRNEFPEASAVTEDFEPKGRFYEAVLLGMADAAGAVGAAFYHQAKDATGKGAIAPLFFMKCRADWAETAVARRKLKDADEDDTFVGMDITVTK